MAWGTAGSPNFGLRLGKVGRWVGDGTYTGVVAVPSIQMIGYSVKTLNGELEGNDAITDSHGQAIKGTCRLRFGSVSLATLSVLTGQDLESTGSGSTARSRMTFYAEGFPYFGVAGLSIATNRAGGFVGFGPKAKIVSDFSVADFEYGKYTIPDLTVDLIPDDTYRNQQVSEVQSLAITSATGGTFTLSFQGATTAAIAYDAVNSAIEAALELLGTIGTGNVTVTGTGPFTITFGGELAYVALPLITADATSLTGSGHAAAVTSVTEGVDPTAAIFDILEYKTAPTLLTLPPVF